MALDPDDLRRFAARDWEAPARLARRERATRPIAEKVAIAVALYEATRAANETWPDESTRAKDFEAHLRLHHRLQRAAHVGAR